uniref:Neuronal pentraxin receptor a n=1 Tax=Oreochromis niloticus TaxID=8128 RepID=I3JPI9_ORENI
MKFIVIILAAGMVAFIGAVICIIAAVHTGSSKAAAAQQQPAVDNHSLYPDAAAQTPAAAGSVARPGSLGALHGSETPDSEAPTFNIGLGGLDGVTGLTGHDPTVSRLICTPIPAGECNPKNFQQQADDPSLYAGEDWGYLRTTAEELRQTVLQQKDQILTDQRTIRELTGKLSECEKGLDGKSGRSSGSSSAGRRGMRAVDELEQAITQLKDRIEKLEVGRVSRKAHKPPSAYKSTGSDSSWRMDDLEVELEKKVQLLEKERKALRLETEKHNQEIERGINKLHHRISGLEEGFSGHSFPEGYRLSFPTRTNYMYAVVTHSMPKLRAFTICLWLRPAERGIGTPVSYAVPEQPNELVLLQGLHAPAELLINDKVLRVSDTHLCELDTKGRSVAGLPRGRLKGEGHGLAAGHHIRPDGVLILGQEQDSLGGGFDSSQALVGELSQVGLWDRVLTSNQVASLARCGKITQGSVVPWAENGVDVYGGATKDPGEPCSKHSRSSQ